MISSTMSWIFILLIKGVLSNDIYGDIPEIYHSPSQRKDNLVFLRLPDIARIIGTVITFKAELSDVVNSVIPQINRADDPLNKFVDVTTVLENINPLLLEAVKTELKCDNDESDAQAIVDGMQAYLPFTLESVLHGRSVELSKKQNERVTDEVMLAVDKLKGVVQNISPGQLHADDIGSMVLEVAIEDFTNSEIKKVLSYQAVKEDLERKLKTSVTNDVPRAEVIASALEPFLREALLKTDISVVMSQFSTYAESTLCQRIASHITDCIKEGIRISTDIDNILRHEHSNGIMFKNIESIYLEDFNKLISFEMQKNFGQFFVENQEPNKFQDKHYFKIRPKLNRLLYEQIADQFNDEDQLVLSRAMVNLNVIRDFFSSRIKHRLYHHSGKNNFEHYVKTHKLFIKENFTSFSNFVAQLVETKYRDIDPLHLTPLNGTTLEQHVEKINPLSKEEMQFLDELEKEATTNYDFAPGMFKYSISFYKILMAIFPALNSPFGSDEMTKAPEFEKDEL